MGDVELPLISAQSRLELRPYVVHRTQGAEPLLACPQVGAVLEVDEDTIVAVDALAAERTIGDAAARLVRDTGNEYDLLDLAYVLGRRGFIRAIDGEPLATGRQFRERHPRLHAIEPKNLTWLTHPVFLASLGAVLTIWIALIALEAPLRPRFSDALIWPRPALAIIASMGGLLVLSYLHELAHFFVARRYGIDAKITLSHRFYILTLQTDVTNAWVLPVRQRLAIFCAGITFNATLAALGTFAVAYAELSGTGQGLVPYLKFFVYLNMWPIFFQIYIPARTDLYFVLMTLVRERNLFADSLAYLAYQARAFAQRLLRRLGDPCPACTRSCANVEVFCRGCGAALPKPNEREFTYERRWKLTAFGVVFVGGSAYAYWYFLGYGFGFATSHARTSASEILAAVQTRSILPALEGMLAFALAILQCVFIVVFLSTGIGRPLWNAQRRRILALFHAPLLRATALLPRRQGDDLWAYLVKFSPEKFTTFTSLAPTTPTRRTTFYLVEKRTTTFHIIGSARTSRSRLARFEPVLQH